MSDLPVGLFYKNASQALNTSWQNVVWDVTDVAEFITLPTTTRIKVPTSGIYEVSYVLANITSSVTNWELLGRLYNQTTGKAVHQSYANAGTANNVTTQNCVTHKFYVKLTANDEVSVQARATTAVGTPGLSGTSESYTSVSIRFIGESVDAIEAASSITGSTSASVAGRLRLHTTSDISGVGSASASPRLRLHTAPTIYEPSWVYVGVKLTMRQVFSSGGTSDVTGDGRVTLHPTFSVNRAALVTSSPRLRVHGPASISGDGFVVAAGRLTLYSLAEDLWTLSGDATSLVTTLDPLPGHSRSFYSGVESLSPLDTALVGLAGDPAVDNKVGVTGPYSMAVSLSYSGAPYTFDGLGFKRGDKIKLFGPVGTEPNHGKELTFEDPATVTTLEKLYTPDTTEYEFVAFRRNL